MMTLTLHLGFLKSKQPTPKDIYLNAQNSEGKESFEAEKFDHLSVYQKEIFLLLQKIEESPYEFIRNGVSYDGKKASKHFRWKYSYGVDRIKKAEEFIDHIATRSMKTNRKYLVKLSDSEIYPLGDILYNELATIRSTPTP